MLILPQALAVPRAGAYRQDGRNASSQMQSIMRPSYILIVLTLRPGQTFYLSESLLEVSSYPHPRAGWLYTYVVGLPRVSACGRGLQASPHDPKTGNG